MDVLARFFLSNDWNARSRKLQLVSSGVQTIVRDFGSMPTPPDWLS